MLTIATINPKQAEEYYQQENYYSKGAALENSEWWGRGAATLGLNGVIAHNEIYRNLINGLSPDGKQQLRAKPKGKGFAQQQPQANSQSKHSKQLHKQSQERAGVDLTFSAPKSVSIACLVGGDKRLEEAHRQAVKRTLEFIEKHYPQTRIKGQRVQTDNLTVAMWHHDTSRELDPHLHTHCIAMNFTQLANGNWQSRTDENLYYNKMLLGQIYRNELALECRKLGYEIEPHPKELFEIKGYTREQIEAFSKRHSLIVQYLEEREINVNTESKVWAWRRTRVKKNHEIDRNEMLPYWHEEADLYGIIHPEPTPTLIEPEIVQAKLQAAVNAGIEHCSERKVAFKPEEIEKFVTAQIQPFGITQLESAITQHPQLLKTFDGRLTTQAALERELATIRLMHKGKGQAKPISHLEIVESYLENKKLTLGQREAIALAATTSDSFIAWQGVAGAGKTYALSQLKQISKAFKGIAQDYQIKGFAPSAEAAKVLGEELGIEAHTIASLLNSKQLEAFESNSIWLVDEAGMLSAADAHALLQRATAQQARVILVGDVRQLSAVEAGNPFKSLQQAGISTAYLNESLRQKPPDLQLAVNLAARGQMDKAVAHLEQVGRVEEIPAIGDRAARIAQEYIKLSLAERQNTLVLAGTHKERLAITQQIRSALKEEGTQGYEIKALRLQAKDLTSIQSRYTHHYQIGDVIVPIREYRRCGLHKSQAYKVEAITKDKLTLSDLAGNELVVDPMNFRKSVYQQEVIEIAVGDRLKWTRNDKHNGRRNGQEFTLTGIEEQTATIEYDNGKIDRIDLESPLHLDYALVSTTYSSQGKTANRVLVSSTVDRTVSQESFYVAISRAKDDLQIFAEDREFLHKQVQQSNAQETALELLTAPQLFQLHQAVSREATKEAPTLGLTQQEKVIAPPKDVVTPIRLREKPVTPKPKPLEAFWTPTPAGKPPTHIEEKHWKELVEDSAIDPALLTSSNVRSLGIDAIEQEHEAWEYLMYSDKLERTNTGRLSSGILKHYQHIEHGGWWASAGIDARSLPSLQSGEKPRVKLWGCFKPDCPRVDNDKSQRKGKTEYIKYEHPLKEERQLFLFDVPDALAQRIYDKYGIQPTPSEKQSGFWYITYKYNLPITLAEGAKKTLSSLSQGEITIGVSGVNGGYYANDLEHNRLPQRILHPELEVFATRGREFRFALDQDSKQSTIWNVRRDLVRTGELLELEGCSVRVVQWQAAKGKGLDDLIVSQGPLAYIQSVSNSIPLDWEANKHYRGEYSRLAKKVKDSLSTLSAEAIDIEVYKLALFKRDIRDGARTIAQSDQARSFKATMPTEEAREKTFSYIGRIEKLISVQSRQLKNEQQQPVHQSNEAYYDINTQLFQPELTVTADTSNERNRLIDRRTNGVESKQHQADGENRFTREQPKSIEGGSDLSANQPEPNPQRVDAQMGQLLAATNQYAERHEAESVGASLERFYPNFAQLGFSSRGAEKLTSPNAEHDATILDSPRTDARIDPEITRPEITRQCLNAITGYIEQQSIEIAIIETLPALTQKLNQLTHKPTQIASSGESLPKLAVDAIAEYIEQQSIEATIIENLPAFTQKLNQLTQNFQREQPYEFLQQQAIDAITQYTPQQSIEAALSKNLPALSRKLNQLTGQEYRQSEQLDEFLQTQAINAIAQYIEQQSIEAAIVENLPAFSEQLNQLKQKGTQTERLDEALQTQAIDAIAEYTPQQSIEAAISEALPGLTQTLNQLDQQKFDQSTQLDESLPKQAVDAITGYIEQQSIESLLVENLPALSEQLHQLTQKIVQSERLDESLQTKAVDAIAEYIQQQSIEAAIIENLPALTQKLNQLNKQPTQTEQLDESLHTQAIDVIAGYIEQQSIEVALIENLAPLTQKLNQLTRQKFGQSERLDESLQTQAIKSLAEAIANYHDQVAINEVIMPDFQQLVQRLAQVGHSQLTEQLQQAETLIQPVTNSGKGEGRPTRNTNNQDDLQVDKPGLPQAGETSDNQTRLVSTKEASFIEQHEMIERLTDRDFLQLYQNVVKHFKAAPLSPPPISKRQLVKNEVQQLINQINDLRQNQVKQINIVESMQKNRFRAWDKKYNPALMELQKATKLINQLTTQKTQKDNQIKEWSKQDEIYQAWKHSPYTTQMRTLAEVFAQPQMQERLTQIQRELEKTSKIIFSNYNKHQNMQSDQEISL